MKTDDLCCPACNGELSLNQEFTCNACGRVYFPIDRTGIFDLTQQSIQKIPLPGQPLRLQVFSPEYRHVQDPPSRFLRSLRRPRTDQGFDLVCTARDR